MFAYRIEGKITTDELKPLATVLEQKIQQYGKIRAYAEYVSTDGITPGAV